MRSRKFLALLFCLITFPAIAGYMTLLGAGVGSIAPTVSWVAGTDAFPDTSLTYSGPSLSTMFDSTGKLTYKPNNLLTYSNTFSNAAWTKTTMTVTSGATDPFGTSFAWTLTATGPGALLYQLQSLAGPNAIPYVWMRRKTGSGIIYLRNANNVSIDVTAQVSSSWSLVYVAPTAALGSNLFLISLATSGDEIEIYSTGYSAVTYETTPRNQDKISTGASAYYGPRIDYDPNTLAIKGLLIEEARTNYATYSNNMAGGTLTANGGAIAGGVADLSGGTTGITFTATAGNATHHAIKTGGNSLTAGTKYTATFWLKQGNAAYTVFGEIGDTPYVWGSIKWSDLSVQTNGQDGAIVSTPIAFGGGIYQVSITYTRTITGASILGFGPNTVSAATIGNAANIFNAAGTETAICVAWQIEAGAFSTSFIPTAAASVTRAADVVQFAGAAANALAAANGSVIAEFGPFQNVGSNNNIVSFSTSVALYANSATTYAFYQGGNVTSATVGGGASVKTATTRMAFGWSPSGNSFVANSGTVATNATAVAGQNTSQMYFASTASAGTQLGGWVRSFAIYNQRLPDATLTAKSVVGASY